ncbi:hypothetical protein [Methylobacterium sp. A54F]
MMNFVFGTIAGGIIACIATIAAARHPDVQERLGLLPVRPAALAPAVTVRPPEPPCRALPQQTRVTTDEVLFSKRRFWSLAP